jgi:hypothetical protein
MMNRVRICREMEEGARPVLRRGGSTPQTPTRQMGRDTARPYHFFEGRGRDAGSRGGKVHVRFCDAVVPRLKHRPDKWDGTQPVPTVFYSGVPSLLRFGDAALSGSAICPSLGEGVRVRPRPFCSTPALVIRAWFCFAVAQRVPPAGVAGVVLAAFRAILPARL